MSFDNGVTQAVRMAGGPTCVAGKLQVSSRAVNTWQHKGYVPNFYHAEKLALLAGIPIEGLRRAGSGYKELIEGR